MRFFFLLAQDSNSIASFDKRECVQARNCLFVTVFFSIRISSTQQIVPIGIIDLGQLNSAHLCRERNYISTVY